MAPFDQILEAAVGAGAVPNVVAIAANRQGVVYTGSAGPLEVGGVEPVTIDSQFRIMSMTKIITTAAALQLMERGRLDVDAPVEMYCPDFAKLQVLEGFEDDTPSLRPPATRATVKHLMTHTSGLGYRFWSDDLVRWEKLTTVANAAPGSAGLLRAPLLADPGAAFRYGVNTDWLGKVVEAAGGSPLDVTIREAITGPLRMDNTTFVLDDAQRAALTPVHVKKEGGAWTSIGEILSQSPDWFAGGYGLYSTPRDYIRFEQALLGGGQLDGARILQASTVDATFTNQLGTLDFPAAMPTSDPASSCDFNVGPGFKWGYGLLLNSRDLPGRRRAGSGAWAGLCNTQFWIDRSSGICASIFSNFLPFVTPEALKLYADFERALYRSFLG